MVEPGYGFIDQAEASTRVDFTDVRADWRTIHLTVAVDRQFGGGDAVGRTVRIGFVIGAKTDFNTVRQAFLSMTSNLFILGDSNGYGYDPDLYTLQASGVWLITVGEGGSLSMPALSHHDTAKFLGATDTLAEVAAAGLERRTVIENPVYGPCAGLSPIS